MKGMMACMIYYPRACGSLRVSITINDMFFFSYFLLEKANHCPLQEKLGAYFLSKMDSDNPKVQEVSYIWLWN